MTNRSVNGKGSIHLRVPIAPIVGRLGLKAPTHGFAPALALEIEHPAAVGNLEFDMIAADETVNRGKPVTGRMDHQLAVEKAVGLRAQPQLNGHIVSAGQTV